MSDGPWDDDVVADAVDAEAARWSSLMDRLAEHDTWTLVEHPNLDDVAVGDPVPIWTFKLGARVPLSNEALGISTDPTPVPRWRRWRRRVRWWWWEHRPHVHLGPCDDGGDY